LPEHHRPRCLWWEQFYERQDFLLPPYCISVSPLLCRTRVFFCEVISRANLSHRFLLGPQNRTAHLATLCDEVVSQVITHFLCAASSHFRACILYRHSRIGRPRSQKVCIIARKVQSDSQKMPGLYEQTELRRENFRSRHNRRLLWESGKSPRSS